MQNYLKPVDELEFTDDFMFTYLMRDKSICKEVLERLLKIKVKDIKYPELQKSIASYYQSHGIRLDVYVENEEAVYDVEMQCRNFNGIERRVRYYQSMIDIDHLSKGEPYENLKKSYILFICKTDIFGYGFPVYEVKQLLNGKADCPYDDGTRKIFYNSSAYSKEKDEALYAFLQYICQNEACDDFTEKLQAFVERAKHREGFRSDYMGTGLFETDARHAQKREDAERFLMENISPEVIARCVQLPLKEIEEIKKNLENKKQ